MFDFKPPYLGSAYYPEAWPREQIDEDLDLMVSHGLNIVRVGEFAWSTMEPREGEYDLSLFREVVDKCRARGIAVIMCTPTATLPSWMEHRYPDVMMRVGNDIAIHGGRRLSCPTSPRLRAFTRGVVEALGREFGQDENVVGWQIDNEIVTLVKDKGCTCPSCRAAWIAWLRARYGTVEELNRAWGHYTWSLNFASFEEVDIPQNGLAWFSPSHNTAWAEYKNDVYLDMMQEQADILHRYTKAPVGTDLMPTQQFDLGRACAGLDIAQLNHYSGPRFASMYFDAFRCLKKDRPFWVTETSTCWNGSNAPQGPRAPGFLRANALAPFAYGGEANLFWLFRAHYAGHEQMHGSCVDSWGREMHIAPELRETAHALDRLRPMLDGTRVSRNGMAVELAHRPFFLERYEPMALGNTYYNDFVRVNVHQPIHEAHFRPDVIMASADLSDYRMIVTVQHYTIEEEGFAERILPWVENGGTWVVGPLSDVMTPEATKYREAPFGHLEKWANVRRAFFVPAPNRAGWYANDLPLGKTSDVVLADGTRAALLPYLLDVLEPGDGVKVLARYAEDADPYVAGRVAATETRVGKGRIILLGAQLDHAGFRKLITDIAAECGITPIAEASDHVALSLRTGPYGTVLCAVEESGTEEGYVTLPFAGREILTGRTYARAARVPLRPYDTLFIEKTE